MAVPGVVVRLLREAHNWTQQELADRSGYSQATTSRVERGVSRAARDTTVLTDLAGALGVPPAVLGVVSAPEPSPLMSGGRGGGAATPGRPSSG
ncbi:MAG: helix-turn-helix domain-containing protein [Pseudonocardiaceae bacterium]